jgi:uncharacterized protein YodC (DUF2158 family)
MLLKIIGSPLIPSRVITSFARVLLWSAILAVASTIAVQSGRFPHGPVLFAPATTAEATDGAQHVATGLRIPITLGSGLKVGDLVRFVTGGPLMTVRAIEGNEAVCSWESFGGRLRTHRYLISELIVIGSP